MVNRWIENINNLNGDMIFNRSFLMPEEALEKISASWIHKSITCSSSYDIKTKLIDITFREKQTNLRNVYESFLPLVVELINSNRANNTSCLLVDSEGYVVYYYQGSGRGLGMQCNATTGRNRFVMDELLTGKTIEAELHSSDSNDFLYSILSPIKDINDELVAIFIFASSQELSQELLIKYYLNIQLCYAHYQYLQYLPHYANSILNGIPDCALLMDKNNTIIQANQKVTEVLNIPQTALLGKQLNSVLNQENGNWNIKSTDKQIIFTLNERDIPCSIINQYTIPAWNDLAQYMLIFKPDKSFQESSPILDQQELSPFTCLVGDTSAIKKIKSLCQKIAGKPTNILIQGESGTGKELLAEAIHLQSGRQGPFIPINCGAIPKELLLSELFGYEGGTFTGARKDGKAGKLEIADHGTIFLDEIGEMPIDMQVSLLRFLQDKKVTRLGSNSTKKVDVRIIAATNRNLLEEVSLGNFREDLYYRLNVINVTMPPLRERQEDIPTIVQYILQKLCREYDLQYPVIEPAVMDIFKHHFWHGNVRELQNVVEVALLTNEGDVITKDDLPPYLLKKPSDIRGKKGNIQEYYKLAIMEALNDCDWNISLAAKTLGISRNTLYKKIQEFNIRS